MKLKTIDGRYGDCLLLEQPWRSSFADFMREHDIVEINVSSSNNSLSFLFELPFLRGLNLFVYEGEDYEAIESLTQLRSFYDAYGFNSHKTVDFSKLRDLENFRAEWGRGLQSVFYSKSLKSLYLDKYKAKTFEQFSTLGSLEGLFVLSYTVETLDGICQLQKLALWRILWVAVRI